MNASRQSDSRPLAAIDRLPRSIEPARDLWPGVRQGLAPRRPELGPPSRRRGLWAVAASLVVAFTAGLMLGRQEPSPVTGTPLTLAAAAAPSLAAALEATEREYQAAYKGFRPVGVAPSVLQPKTSEDLAASWASMQQAETALLTALEEHPDNPYLAEKLLDLRTQQLDFMRQLHMLDQNSRRNT